MATTEETDVECVKDHNFQYDELTKTDHWLQQLQGTKNSKLAAFSTVLPHRRPKPADAVLDESNKTECASSPQHRIRYVLYHSQSSIEYSGSETLGNITTRIMSQNEILTSVTSVRKQDEILKHITTSSIPEDEMLPGSMSTDRVSEHSLVEHFCYEKPNCLLKTFTEQLSITCQMPTDEVSIDGVNEDTHEENPNQMYKLCYNENGATTVNELQPSNNTELLERGLLEQNSAPGRGILVTPYTRRPTVDQAAQPTGLTCLRSTQGQRTSRSAKPVPRILQPSSGMRIPVELRSIPNRHNEFILQVNPAATCSKPLPHDSDTPNVCSSSGGATTHMNSSLESPSVAPTTPSSSSSVISGTDRKFVTAEGYPPSKDGWMHHKNGHIQAMHIDTRKQSQTEVDAGIMTGSNLSKQHLVQSRQNQQNRPMMNSDVHQYNYFDGRPFVHEHHMLDPRLCRQQWNYDWPHSHLPDLRILCNANDTDPTTSRRQTPSIAYETVCPQKHSPLQVGAVCNAPNSFYNCVKDNSYLTPRGSQFHQTNQHSYSNHYIPCVNRLQVHACASTGKPLSPVCPSQSRHTQPVYVGNHCLAQNQHIIHGQCQRPVNHKIASKQNSFSRHKKSEPPVQQSHKANHDSGVHASTEATTEGLFAGTTQVCHWSTGTPKPQSKHINTGMDKVNQWLRDEKNVSIGEHLRRYEHNNQNTYNERDTQQANQHGKLTPRHTHVLVEHSGTPMGLFDGQPLPDGQQAKPCVNKKHSPHNACLKETVKKGSLKHPCPKEVQKNKTQTVDRNCISESSLQFQHYNNTDICHIYRPELPTSGLCSDKMIDRIRQKQLPKYKSSVALHCRCCESHVPKADEANDEQIKLREEKSLKEPAVGLPTSLLEREHVDKERLYILPDSSKSLKATPSSNRNNEELPQTVDAGKHSQRQLDCDPVCQTRPDQESWLAQMSGKENDAPVRQEQSHIQTCNTNMHGVKQITSASCSKQISRKYCDDTAVKCGTDNAFDYESAFLYPYLNNDKENAELDRMPAYTQGANNARELDVVSYDAPNDQNTESIKLQYGITDKQTALSTLQTHKVPPDYVKKYADNTSAEHVTDRQFVDVNHRLPASSSGSQNIYSTQTQIHSYENARCVPPDLPNNCGKHSATSCHTTNVHSDHLMSQCIPHSFQNNQRPSLLHAAQTCESQSVSTPQSKTNQHCYTAPPSRQASFLMTTPPCFVGAASSSQGLQESPFKTPYSVDQHPIGAHPDHPSGAHPHHPSGAHPHHPSGAHPRHPSDAHRDYYEAIQTAPCYPSIGSDVSMSSDNSLSRAQIINVSTIDKMHSYQQNLGCKDTPPTCYQLQYQGLQVSSQNLQKQNNNLQLHLENQQYKYIHQQEQVHLCLHQRDKQVVSQDRHDFHRHGSKGGMHLPCFLQSADCDDDVIPGGRTNPQMISPHLLNQMSRYQNAECTQSETLESIMTSISEKSQMSTSTSNDCYADRTQASEPHFPDTAAAGSSSTAQLNLNLMSETSSKTAPSLQQSSASSSNVTNRDTNIHSSTGSHFPEAAPAVFPQLDFEDCRDAIPLSPSSSPDTTPIQTLTKPDQVLVTDDGQGQRADQPTLRNCKNKSVEPLPYMNSGVGTSSSISDD